MVYVSHQFEESCGWHHIVLLRPAGCCTGGVNDGLRPELQSSVGPDLVGAVLSVVTRRPDTAGRPGRWQGTLQSVWHVASSRVRLQCCARRDPRGSAGAGLSVPTPLASTVTAISNDDYEPCWSARRGRGTVSPITQICPAALKLPRAIGVDLVKAVSTRRTCFR